MILAVAATFLELWMGRVAFPPSDGVASIYCDRIDARGKHMDCQAVSCAHRTERLGAVLVVTNTATGKRINCPVLDRGPYYGGRVLDLSPGAAKAIGCTRQQGLCPVTVRRPGFE